MSARRDSKVEAIDTWRRRPVYRAQIVNSEAAAIVVKSGRGLRVGQRITFARVSELAGGRPSDWRSGVIWRINKGRLHLTRT